MEEKINRILENTEATRRNFDDYQSTNDLQVSQLEAELKDLKERFIDSEARKSTENGYAALLSSTDVKIAKQQALKTHISSGLIVVKFSSFETKLEAMAAKKQESKRYTRQLNRGLKSVSPIFLNHHLTPQFAALFFRTKLAIGEGL